MHLIDFVGGKISVLDLSPKLNSVALVLNELYRPSDRRMSAKLMSTFADRGCRVISETDLHGR
jgi:hypothetical protein